MFAHKIEFTRASVDDDGVAIAADLNANPALADLLPSRCRYHLHCYSRKRWAKARTNPRFGGTGPNQKS
jgi:hypothetical protein